VTELEDSLQAAIPSRMAIRRPRSGTRFAIVATASLAIVTLTQDLPYLLSWPLWGDEAWVVLSRLFPIEDLPTLASSSPVVWNLLVQFFSLFGDTGGRILTLLFHAAAITAAFYAGRWMPWRPGGLAPTALGAVTALGVALAPGTLARVDIKHYAADAFVTLLALALTFRSRTHTRTVFVLAFLGAVGVLLSFATVFAVPAAFLALLVSAVVERRRVGTLLVSGAVAAVGMVGCYVAFAARGDNEALRDFWTAAYPRGILDVPKFLGSRILDVDASITFLNVAVIALFVGATLVVSARLREWAVVVFPAVVLTLMIILGVMHRYPLLDQRTSHFFVVLASFYATVGALVVVATALRAIPQRVRMTPLLRSSATMLIVSLSIILLSIPNWRAHRLPMYDTTHQSDYVEAHLRPGDLVLYNELAGYQLALSWHMDEPSWCSDPGAWTGYVICYPGSDRIAGFRSLDEAYAAIDRHVQDHPGSRVWLIRSHVFVDYEQMERDLPMRYAYRVIDLPIQPVGVVDGFRDGGTS
jgi:hypothetical protein